MSAEDAQTLRAILAAGVLFALVLVMGILLDRRFSHWDTPCLATRYLPATLFALLAAIEARRRWQLSFAWAFGLVASYNIDFTIILWLMFPVCLEPSVFSTLTATLFFLMPVVMLAGWYIARGRA